MKSFLTSFVKENDILHSLTSGYLARYFQWISQNKSKPHNMFSLSLELSNMYACTLSTVNICYSHWVGFPIQKVSRGT